MGRLPDFRKSAIALSMAVMAELDLGERARSMTTFAMRIRASGKPIFWAASRAVTVCIWASGLARPMSS